jgi:hypothetical protein
MGGQRPHVEIAAVIPDGQGKIVIGKRKGKTGTGMNTTNTDSLAPYDKTYVVEPDVKGSSDAHTNNRTV